MSGLARTRAVGRAMNELQVITGTPPAALTARVGHADFATTQLYIILGRDLAASADRLARHLWGDASTKNGTTSSIRYPP